jgi:hypothetical protein
MSIIEFKVSFPTDNGFWGRECNICNKYFKIDSDKIKDNLFCPYCGDLQPNKELWTKEQNQIARKIATQIGKRFIEDEMEKKLKDVFKNSKTTTYTPGSRTKITQPSSHIEKEVDTEINCPSCDMKFQVYGIFGFCPGCKEDNILIYEANLKILLQEIDNSNNPNRTLRHAYNDLVSTFESYCKRVSERHNLGVVNFQNLKNTKEHFKKDSLNIYEGISDVEKTKIKRVFEKRHAYQHAKGNITAEYIKNIPEDAKLINTLADLSRTEFTDGVEILKKVFRTITNKYSS